MYDYSNNSENNNNLNNLKKKINNLLRKLLYVLITHLQLIKFYQKCL